MEMRREGPRPVVDIKMIMIWIFASAIIGMTRILIILKLQEIVHRLKCTPTMWPYAAKLVSIFCLTFLIIYGKKFLIIWRLIIFMSSAACKS